MKTVYFVRHGQSEANARRITAGSGLDVPLTNAGRNQAAKVGEILEKKGIELVVSSPQIRALETARIIASRIGYPADKIVTNDKFAERYLGELTGKPHDEVQNWFAMGQTPPGGESAEAMYSRVASGIDWLRTLDADKILLVSHGGPGRVIRALVRGERHTSIDTLASVGNAEVLELTL